MSYLWIVVLGAVAGFIASKSMKESDYGVGIDLAVAVVGAVVLTVVLRMLMSDSASGLVASAIITILGSVGSLIVARRFFMTPALVVKPRRRRV